MPGHTGRPAPAHLRRALAFQFAQSSRQCAPEPVRRIRDAPKGIERLLAALLFVAPAAAAGLAAAEESGRLATCSDELLGEGTQERCPRLRPRRPYNGACRRTDKRVPFGRAGDAAFLRAAGEEHRAGRGQRLRLAAGAARARRSRAIRSSSSSSATSGCRRACSSRWAPACWSIRSGIVVTNYHVIRDADEVKVATVRRPRVREQGAAQGRALDLAVLKIEAPAAVPGDRDRQFRCA